MRLSLFLVLFLAGCGETPAPRFELSGTVKFKDQPVPVGTILFIPDESKGNRGPGTTAGIQNGTYRTVSGQGTIGGPHKVRLSGYDGKVKPMPGAPGEQTIPANPPLFENVEFEVDLPRDTATQNFALPRR